MYHGNVNEGQARQLHMVRKEKGKEKRKPTNQSQQPPDL